MEKTAISGIHYVPQKATLSESNYKTQETSNVLPSGSVTATCHQFTNNRNDIGKVASPVTSEDHDTVLNTVQNVGTETSSPLPKDSSDSKSVRLKTSDKLTKVIETCKKLQKLSEQSTVKMKHLEAEDVLNISVGVGESVEKPSCVTSGTGASEPVSEVSVNLPKSSEEDLCLMSENGENDSSSSSLNSSNRPQSSNEDSSASRSKLSTESTSDLALKRFLFLFRPSDHEVLVRNKGINMYRCNVCGGMYRQKFSLKRHFLRTHINFRYISKSDISNCKIAVPEEYVPQDSNVDCSKTPHGSKYRKKFKSSNAIFLENNKARVMRGLYICHICVGVQFDLEHELRDHYNKHSDAERKKFQCDKCSASFFKKQILSRHLASHGERVVRKSCKRCGAEFSSVMEYQKHLISHSSGRVCKYCSKILSTSANRKRHEALHLGLKPYRCSHCGMSFAQSKDLDRHLKKQHTGLCYFCETCNKLFPSQASLDVHMHEKHSDSSPKKVEKSPSPELANRPTVAKPESVPVTVPVKLKVCFVCKRSFQSFYAMMKHRTQAHPYHTKRRKNRKTMKQKMEQAKQAATKDQGTKIRKPYGRPPKKNSTFPTSTVRRGRPPLDRSVKFGRQYERSGPRFLTKRDKELAKKDEIEFYFNLSEKIAENLLHFVDGKTSQLSLKAYNFSDQRFPPCNFEERGRFPWSNFNFPNEYDVDHALNTRGHEVKNKFPENLSHRDKCLYATGLNRIQKLPQVIRNISSDRKVNSTNDISETGKIGEAAGIDIKKLNLQERKKLIGRKVPVACLCYVCKEKFESNDAFEEHCVNNHPNVDCSCIEIEGDKGKPPAIPGDLCKQNITPDGIFFSWNVPPPLSSSSLLKCTKCKSDFKTSFELHSHIIKCGNLRSSPCHVWKPNTQKRIKRTMKSRMSFARQQAAVNAYAKSFKTPEKQKFGRNDAILKSCEKISKSAEKSQFYKSGRLQTTSFTVDMNYFKTKPVKPPANTQSKRGRKSYATLSYRYRNASAQSSASECPNCKEIFPSQSAQNIHLQHHCIYSVPKRNEKLHSVTNSSLRNTSGPVPSPGIASTANSSFSGLNQPKNFQEEDRLHNSSGKAPFPQSTNDMKLTLASKTSNNYAKEAKKDILLSKSDKLSAVVDMKITDTVEAPMDLSKHSDIQTSVSVDFSNKEKGDNSEKSALEIAMEAIQEYYQNSEQNEHISKLQKTVENLTASSPVASTQVQKPVVKRVGRPKKVKKQVPFHLKKNLTALKSIEAANSKPVSKLEETVKRLTESKVKSSVDTKQQNTSPFKTIDATEKTVNSEKKSGVPSTINLIQPIFRTPVKIVSNDISKSPSTTAFKPTTSITLSVASNFVPLIIYGDQSKTNNALVLTSIGQNKEQLQLSGNVCKNSIDTSTSPITSATPEKSGSDNKLTSEKTLKDASETQDVLSAANADSPDSKSEKTRLSSSSQGRISPSLESIVNSIKQKLHSQEQDSSPHDDVAISWLEDEKFEIPSGPKLILPSNSSSSSPLSVDNETFYPVSSDNLDLEKSDSNKLLKSSCENIPKIVNSETAIDKTKNKNAFASSVSQKIESLLVNSVSSPTLKTDMKNDKPVDCLQLHASSSDDLNSALNSESLSTNDVATVHRIKQAVSNPTSELQISQVPTTEKRARIKVAVLTPANKKTYIRKDDPQVQSCVRKKPGRPRKKMAVEPDTSAFVKTAATQEINLQKTALKDELHIQKPMPSALTVENAILAENGTELIHNVDKESNILEIDKINDLTESKQSHNQHELSIPVNPESDDSEQRPSCASTPDNVGALLEENSNLSKMSTLRAFRTKSKVAPSADSELIAAVEPKLTTEFGKSLASRMKEKMRLSFEIGAPENIAKPDEGNNSDGVPDVSDINSMISDDDSEYLREIKKEIEGLEPSKKHSCPFCMLEFAYLTNFRRHLRLCRARLETKEIEPVPCTSTTVLQYLPKKDEVEHSMLNLLRHQSRQTQMLKEAEKSSGSKVESKFRTYNCNVCHRIYLSLFKLLQHQVTHKLESKDSSEINADLDDPKDINDIEKFSENELNERNIHGTEISEDIDPKNAIFVDDNKPVETLSSVGNETELNSNIEVNPDFTVDKIKIEHISEIIEGVVNANDTDMESESVQTDSLKNLDLIKVSVKTEEQPVKRKRGRPLGWRKNKSIVQDNFVKKVFRKNFKTCKKPKAVVFGIKGKAGKLRPGPVKGAQKKFFVAKLDVKTGKKVTSKLTGKVISRKNLEFAPDVDLSKNIPVSETIDTKLKVSNLSKFQDTSLTSKEIPKKTFKRSSTKGSIISNDTSKDVDSGFHTAIQEIKTEQKLSAPAVQNNDSSQSVKDSKGRCTTDVKTEAIGIKTEFPLKRRPGRPPKASLSPMPSTSSQSQPSSSRRFGKMVTRTIFIDSSDSEYDVPEKDVPKKKVFKMCPVCKEKFSASLACYRHIQLVHNRRSEPSAPKGNVTTTPKTVKKVLSKSPDNSVNPEGSKDLKLCSPKAAGKMGGDSPKTSKKVVTKSVDVINLDSIGTKNLKRGNAKSLSVDIIDKPKRFTRTPSVITVSDGEDFQTPAKAFKKVISRSARFAADSTSPKAVKKNYAKPTANIDFDVGSTKTFKKGFSTLPGTDSDANSPRSMKQRSAKSIVNDSSDAAKKGFQKRISRSFSIGSIATGLKAVRKRTAKSAASVNYVATSPKVVKKFNSKFIADNNSDADSAKKKHFSKSDGVNFDAVSPKIIRKLTKSAADSNSDTDSSKSLKKAVSKSLSMNSDSFSPKVIKRLASKLTLDDSSDADSTKSFRKRSTKFPSIESDASSPKSEKKLAAADSDANSAKSSKRGTVCNSDSESAKSFRKYIRKPATVYNSDSESIKNTRKNISKPISVENSDADSDFSVKADITPKNFRKCPICKEKFAANIALRHHIELVHSRKSTPGSLKNNSADPIIATSPKVLPPPRKIKMVRSSSMRMKRVQSPSAKIQKMIDIENRSALSRQCRKPLPPLKRKWSKRDSPSQVLLKKPKFI